jgi:hypothetical protein
MVANKPQRMEELIICFTTSDIQEAMVPMVVCCGTRSLNFCLYIFTLATLHLRHSVISWDSGNKGTPFLKAVEKKYGVKETTSFFKDYSNLPIENLVEQTLNL